MKTSSHQWLKHFESNADRTLKLDKDPYFLSREERSRITASIQKFHIGEASEGRILKAKADAYSRQSGDLTYAKLIHFLIREENRHSAYLGHFMREHAIRTKQTTWTDGLFRWLRNLAGLELSIRVLVTAELIAVSYYASLAIATASPQLKQICARMGEEERDHIRFQMLTIHRSSLARSALAAAISDLAHAALMAAATIVVAYEHRAVIRCRSTLSHFFFECYDRFREAMDDGRSAAGVHGSSLEEVRS